MFKAGEKFRVKREFHSGPMKGMIVTEITGKRYKVDKLYRLKKKKGQVAISYRILSIDKITVKC